MPAFGRCLPAADFLFLCLKEHSSAQGAIQQIIAYSGSRLKLNLFQAEGHEVLVSREKVATFKEWLDQ